jgi:hypothetical protein
MPMNNARQLFNAVTKLLKIVPNTPVDDHERGNVVSNLEKVPVWRSPQIHSERARTHFVFVVVIVIPFMSDQRHGVVDIYDARGCQGIA